MGPGLGHSEIDGPTEPTKFDETESHTFEITTAHKNIPEVEEAASHYLSHDRDIDGITVMEIPLGTFADQLLPSAMMWLISEPFSFRGTAGPT